MICHNLGHSMQGAGKSIFYYRQYSRFVIAWATIFCFYCPASFSLHLAFFFICPTFFLSSRIHQFVTPILSANCCQNKNSLKKLVNSDFKIGETILHLSRNENSRYRKANPRIRKSIDDGDQTSYVKSFFTGIKKPF